jgi:hypothetical protein
MTRTQRSTLIAVALAAFVGSCGIGSPLAVPPDPDITLGDLKAEVLVEVASAGDNVEVRFQNLTADGYGYSGCGRGAERFVDGAWEVLPAEVRLCTPALDPLQAHTVVVRRIDVPTDATPGYYRFRFDLHPDVAPGEAERVLLTSSMFRVR